MQQSIPVACTAMHAAAPAHGVRPGLRAPFWLIPERASAGPPSVSEVLAQPPLEVRDELALLGLRLHAAEHRIAVHDDDRGLRVVRLRRPDLEAAEDAGAGAAQRDVLRTRISTLPKIDVALMTVSRWPKSASVRSISTLPKSEKAFVRAPTRQRPLRTALLKTATRLSVGPSGTSGPYAYGPEAGRAPAGPPPAAGRSRTRGWSSPTVLAR